MRIAEFCTLMTGAAAFVLVASIGSPTYVAGDWTETNSELIHNALYGSVEQDLTERLTLGRMERDLPCRAPTGRVSVSDDEIARHLYAVYAIEDYNRPRFIRWVEQTLMRAMLMFEFPIPDWSLGPLQIKPSTAIPHLAAAGSSNDGTKRDAAHILLDACAHGKIGISLIASILEDCRNSASPANVCFAQEYNGNARNPSGPSYAEAVRMLVPFSEAIALIDGSNEQSSTRNSSTPAVPPVRAPTGRLVESLAVAREMEVNLPDRSLPPASWLRAHRRYAHQLTETARIAKTYCAPDFSSEICSSLIDLHLQAAEKWRILFQVIVVEDFMEAASDTFGPASFAVEDLAWSLLSDKELRDHFTAEELSEIGVLLAKGARRYADENPRYVLTSAVFDCLRDDPKLVLSDLMELPTEAEAQSRDAKLSCMRSFLSRLIASHPN